MKFTMNRNFTVASLSGRAVEFKKGVATHVPPQMYDEVQAKGAVPEDDLPEQKADGTPPTGEARMQAIKDAIKTMVKRGAREDFTAAGSPHSAALAKLVGFTVDGKERDAAWTAVQADTAAEQQE
jgi:hypothetical protein